MRRHSTKLIALLLGLVMVFAAVPVMAEDSSSGVGGVVSSIKIGTTSSTYNGSKKYVDVTAYNAEGKEIDPEYYAVSGNRTKTADAGTYTLNVKVIGTGEVTGSVTQTVKYTIKQASKSIKVSTSSKSVSYKKLKKASQYTSAVSVSYRRDRNITMKKLSGSSKITVSGTKFRVKKGTKKGTYKIKVRVYAKGGKNYKSTYKTVYIRVRVK